jgi:hypothetical protein
MTQQAEQLPQREVLSRWISFGAHAPHPICLAAVAYPQLPHIIGTLPVTFLDAFAAHESHPLKIRLRVRSQRANPR